MSTKTVDQIDAEIKKLQDARAEVVRLDKLKKETKCRLGNYGTYSICNYGACSIYNKIPVLICNGDEYVSYKLWSKDKDGHQQGSPEDKNIKGNIFDDLEEAGHDGILLPLTKEEAEYFANHSLYDNRISSDVVVKIKAKLGKDGQAASDTGKQDGGFS